MKSNKNLIFSIAIIVLILVIGSFVLFKNPNVIKNDFSGKEVQVIKLHVENGKYIMTPSTLKKDVTVRIETDISKVPGCAKSIVISAFNVRKTVTQQDNTIEFIPTKAGTFNIACSMNMYQGTFTVLDDNGVKSNYIEKISLSEPTCGSTSGGCGCGG